MSHVTAVCALYVTVTDLVAIRVFAQIELGYIHIKKSILKLKKIYINYELSKKE